MKRPPLKALEQEPCDDAISRQALLDDFGLSEKTRKWGGDHSGYNTMMLYEIQYVIESQPSVKPQEPTGHWINIEDRTDWYDAAYKCSCCGREIITPYELKNNLYSDYPYCHCGAKMVDPQESE